jgi:CheY-like chemotaxis protein
MPLRLLLADNGVDELFLIKKTLTEHGFQVTTACDGQEAIECLTQVTGNGSLSEPLPDIVVLDLDMPKQTGFEVLKWIKAHNLACSVEKLSRA